MNTSLALSLAAAAASIGALHALAPDHWVPFVALSRAQRWSARRTAWVTLACGFGHVTVSALLGLLGLAFGWRLFETFGKRMEAVAGVLLVAFGVVYTIWGMRRAAGRRFHGHTHSHYDHVHDAEKTSVRALFLLFSADPCVAVIPILVAAAPLGGPAALGIVVLYEVATLLSMLALVLPARAGVTRFRFAWLDVHGDTAAGAVIATVGLAMVGLGL